MSCVSATYSIWKYQRHFRAAAKYFAERVFKALDQLFEPQLFLVGILADLDVDRLPACVEPERDFWIDAERFNGVLALAQSLIPTYPETGMLQSHPLAQQRQEKALFYRSIRDAVKKTVESESAAGSSLRYSVSLPTRLEGYLVCTVLGLQDDVIRGYYELKRSVVRVHKHRDAEVAVSLIDAATNELLERLRQELQKPDPGLAELSIDPDDIIRAAGRLLCRNTVTRIDRIEGRHDLFNACSTISSLGYEKSVASGRMILCRKGHPSILPQISLLKPEKLSKYRAARKLFQLASDYLSLHSDSEEVFGLVSLRDYDEFQEDLFEMHVLGHQHWELNHAGHTLMKVRYGVPSLPRLSFDEAKLRSDLARIFRSITGEDISRLVKLIRAAEDAAHGALLIIDENSAAEAHRLRKQGMSVHSCLLTPDLLRQLTTVDGAILLSPDGMCHGFGTILDGMATESGDPSRGARYNSALRYVESAWPRLAVVVSEDGGIDFIPDLPPAIRRSAIDRAIAEIKELRGVTRISRARYDSALDFLDEHRFYLRQEDCDTINSIVEFVETALRKQERAEVWIIRQKFVPNPQLNEELFYQQE
ncbi:MAG: DNA integrity scanning protein DisA nucleotide-binding domain protein [Verrucomicrobia bacterium]|nr:DNA integrity scanning protein DisA nucleotide-binding domain protein [Verrucomicrobiota bacterium]